MMFSAWTSETQKNIVQRRTSGPERRMSKPFSFDWHVWYRRTGQFFYFFLQKE